MTKVNLKRTIEFLWATDTVLMHQIPFRPPEKVWTKKKEEKDNNKVRSTKFC